MAEHVIEMIDATPVKVPTHPISFHYAEHVCKQLQNMTKEGMIRASNSPCPAM